jgi:hypothetical protein
VLEAIAIIDSDAVPETACEPRLALAAPAPASAVQTLRIAANTEASSWPTVHDDDAAMFLPEDERAGVSTLFVRRRRLGWIVASVLATCVAVLAGAVVVTAGAAPPAAVSHAPPAATALPAGAGVAAASRRTFAKTSASSRLVVSNEEVPTIDVRSLPAPVVGTVVGAGSTAFLIDGKRARGGVVVACGRHVVRTSHAKSHAVDVPCGGQITVR